MFPPIAVAPRESSDWQHGAATQPTSRQQPTSHQPRRSWGSSGPKQQQQQERISTSGTRSSGRGPSRNPKPKRTLHVIAWMHSGI